MNLVAITNDHHMRLFHYDKGFEDFGSHISEEISLGSVQLRLPSIEDNAGCQTKSSFTGIEIKGLSSPWMGLDHHPQRYLSRSLTKAKQPFLSSIGKLSMMCFNGTRTSMWEGILFTSLGYDICY